MTRIKRSVKAEEPEGGEAEAEGEAPRAARRWRKRRRGYCWRCAMKRRGALARYSRRRGLRPRGRPRPSRAFRNICARCARWRALDAQHQQALGRTAFLPAHIRRVKGDAPAVREEAPAPAAPGAPGAPGVRRRRRRQAGAVEADMTGWDDPRYEPPPLFATEEDYRDKYNDPLRDYALWVKYEEEQRREAEAAMKKKGG
jgi:hypothetical protein